MNNHLPGGELVIRPASFSDIPYVQQIAYDTWPVAYSNILGNDQLQYMLNLFYSEQALEQQISNGHYFYLALQQFAPVGFASFSAVSDTIFKLHKLYVLPAVQKSGTGRKLLNTVETVAKSMGGKRLQLNVNRNNPAQEYYTMMAFNIIGEADIDIGEGYFMNDYIMEKTL